MENNNTRKKWMVHYSADDYWSSYVHSRHHITDQLNKHFNVLWVNPIGTRVPSAKKKGYGGKIFRKLVSIAKFLRKVNDTFYVITFVTIPYFKKGKLQTFNAFLLEIQTKLVCKYLGIENPLLFYTSPMFANTLGSIRNSFSVYYYSDLYTEYREFNEDNKALVEEFDCKLRTNVDLIMCASKKISDNISSKTSKKVIYFPHQVDYDFFHNNPGLIPDDIKDIKKPIVGYYGTLSDSNNWDIISHCVINRPQYNFVFIGRKDIADTGLEKLDNVFFLGKKPFQDMPAYGHSFTVGVMFWVRREWIVNCSPLKLREYLSIGIPVVSTYIEEVEQNFSDVVYCTDDKELYLKYLDEAITNKEPQRVQKGIDMVKDDSWYNAAKIILYEMDQKANI